MVLLPRFISSLPDELPSNEAFKKRLAFLVEGQGFGDLLPLKNNASETP